MSDSGDKQNGAPREPYDWDRELETQSRPRGAFGSRPRGTGGGAGGRPGKRREPMGVLGWAIVATLLLILAGGAMLGWMGWSFQVEAQRRNVANLGLVPVSADFAPGQTRDRDVLFRIAGSRHLNARMTPELVAGWMRARGWTNVGVGEKDEITTVTGSKDGRQARVLIAKGSAHGGFEAMTQGRVEAVVAARRILPEEADKLSALGDMTSPTNEKILGLDASLVLVNRANRLNAINTETLARIVSGEITDWSQVDPNESGPINVKLEDLGADGGASPAGRLLGDKEPPPGVELLEDSRAIAEAVARDADAIGIARRTEAGGAAKALAVGERNARSVAPDDFSVSTEAYVFSERAHLYIPVTAGEAALRDFAAWALSPPGQEIVARNGLTAQKLDAIQIVPPPEATREYIAFARDARRMNFDIRFDLGANRVDSKAVEDVKRFAAYVEKNQIDERRIAILGFADNVGARATNMGLAQSRAETVGVLFERNGLNTGIIRSYGDAMPVGANAEERGRIRNRRVEVWLCAPPACPLVDLVANAGGGVRGVPSGVRLGPPPPTPEGAEPPKG
jgi:phosphate transport system substrate-binding protein